MKHICAHCLDPIEKFPAKRWRGGPVEYFHHEDGRPDCYHLATVYGHPTPCENCPGPDAEQAFEKFREFMDREVERWQGANKLMREND